MVKDSFWRIESYYIALHLVVDSDAPQAPVVTPRGEPTSAYDFIIIKFNF